jgi:hypothetical protein
VRSSSMLSRTDCRPLFSHLVHASDAEQAEDILRRWQADGVGKVAGEYPLSLKVHSLM